MYKKITVGFVVQTYNDEGNCISQEFIAGDDVTYENSQGEPIDSSEVDDKYQPFDMVQPSIE